MSIRLHVDNLHPWLTSADVARKFRYFGIVNSMSIVAANERREAVTAIVEMLNHASAHEALKSLNAAGIEGREVRVQISDQAQASNSTKNPC